MPGKYIRIAVASAVMAMVVFWGGSAAARQGAEPDTATLTPETIESEAESFRLASRGPGLASAVDAKESRRDLAQFYSLRAYPGAPPVIPHDLLEDKTMGGKGCLGCHRDGGYVGLFKAYAPVTPHPTFENCRGCHVPQAKNAAPFSGTTWTRNAGPEIDNQELAGAPPPIPHSLQMRENCIACHAGPAAVREIRTPHPERVYCRQCHVPAEDSSVFQRAAGGAH